MLEKYSIVTPSASTNDGENSSNVLLTPQSGSGSSQRGAGKGAMSEPNANPFPSTYRPFPSRPTVIRNVHIFTGTGALIRNGALLMRDGKIVSASALASISLVIGGILP